VARIQVITFDLDNTLWDTNTVIRHADTQMRTWLNQHVPEYAQQLNPEHMKQLRAAILAETPAIAHDVSAMRKAFLERAIISCGYPPAEARALALQAFDVFYEARQQVVFFNGALETLAALAAEYRLGALTNGNANIRKIGLDQYFSFAFSSADVGVSKPAPDIFHAALRHCRIDAHEAIHVGDNLIDDIQGAASIGIHTIWTNHANDELQNTTHPPSEIVSHLSELPDAVENIQAR
jgi:putative hydrolase of the HAD superfamily